MPHLLSSRVAEISTTTGTGTLTLGGAITGHRAFSAVLSASDTTEYAIYSAAGEWEVGVGTYSANTLARTTVVASSNAGAAVNFSAGDKFVVITPLATSLQGKFEGTSRRITGDMSNATLANRLAFQTTTTNGNTTISAIANGTGTAGQVAVYAGSDPDNAAFGALLSTTTALQLISNKNGTGSVQPLQVVIGGTVRGTFAAAGDITWAGDVSFSNAIKENVFTITDGASVDINPSNGTIQLWTLGATRTPTASSFLAGESVLLMIDDGTAFSVTWTTIGVVWETDGGSAPTLATSGWTPIVLWKTGTTVHGARVGNA